MANEIRVTAILQVNKGNIFYRNSRTTFLADLNTASGPKPGGLTIPTTGLSVDFSGLITPGFGVIINYDTVNFVEYGIYDGSRFFPIHEVGPGEVYPFKMARNFGGEFSGTGTPSDVDLMRIQANTASVEVFLGVFERE